MRHAIQGCVGRYVSHLALFGAAVLLAVFVVLFLTLLLSLANVELSFTSGFWIFLFLFPGILVFSVHFLASRIGRVESGSALYGIIAGYAGYIILSLAIIVFGHQTDPLGWAFPMLALVAVLVFKAGALFRRLGFESATRSAQSSLPLVIPEFDFDARSSSNRNKREGKQREEEQEKSGKKSHAEQKIEKTTASTPPAEEPIIHLGPQGSREKT